MLCALVVGIALGYVWKGNRSAPSDPLPVTQPLEINDEPAAVVAQAEPTAAQQQPKETAREVPQEVPDSSPPPSPPPAPRETGTPPGLPQGKGARVAIVIDDLGRRVSDVERLAGLGVPMSYAVLPFESRTDKVVGALRGRGLEILCHLPMEPGNRANPGPGALTLGMSQQQLEGATTAALQAVPGAVGVNNHMGSGLSANSPAMSAILGTLKEQGLFFLDSRTSAKTVGYDTALSLGLAAAERDVFLDTDPAPDAIRQQFYHLLEVARRRGSAVAIGHPYDSTYEILSKEIPRARAAGYEFVPVSYLLDSAAAPPI